MDLCSHYMNHDSPSSDDSQSFDFDDFFIDPNILQCHPHPFPTSDLTFNILHASPYLPSPILVLPTGPLAQPAPRSPTANCPRWLGVAPRDSLSAANVPQRPSRQVKVPPEKGRKTYVCTWPGCTHVALKRNAFDKVEEASHHLD